MQGGFIFRFYSSVFICVHLWLIPLLSASLRKSVPLILGYNKRMPVPEFSQPITKPGGLKRLAHILANQTNLAVDTESNSLFAYREQVCLIQFSTRESDYLVDLLAVGSPQALGDLSALGPIFADGKKQHGDDYYYDD